MFVQICQFKNCILTKQKVLDLQTQKKNAQQEMKVIIFVFLNVHNFIDYSVPSTRAASSSATTLYLRNDAENDAQPPVILRSDEA